MHNPISLKRALTIRLKLHIVQSCEQAIVEIHTWDTWKEQFVNRLPLSYTLVLYCRIHCHNHSLNTLQVH